MKKQLLLLLLQLSYYFGTSQIPNSGNVLWLKADQGTYIDGSGTAAVSGQWIQVWADQSGNGNNFSQSTLTRRPAYVANVLCSKPVIRFDVGRGTNLQSPLSLTGPKSIFIVFVIASLSNSAATLLSVKGPSNTFTEVVGTDFSGYHPVSYIADLPGSVSGSVTNNSMGNNANFTTGGNLVTMLYDGVSNTAASSYAARYDAASAAVSSASGKFGRLLGDTTSIGGRVPQQNINYLQGDIAEIIVYNRVLNGAEVAQVENYLVGKYGLLSTCTTLPLSLLEFSASPQNDRVELKWRISATSNCKHIFIEHSTDKRQWKNIGNILPGGRGIIATQEYTFAHYTPFRGANYYRLKMIDNNDNIIYSDIKNAVITTYDQKYIQIYPNPATDFLTLYSAKNELFRVVFIDAKGRTVKKSIALSNSRIDLRDLPGGIYFISASSPTIAGNIKLFKK